MIVTFGDSPCSNGPSRLVVSYKVCETSWISWLHQLLQSYGDLQTLEHGAIGFCLGKTRTAPLFNFGISEHFLASYDVVTYETMGAWPTSPG